MLMFFLVAVWFCFVPFSRWLQWTFSAIWARFHLQRLVFANCCFAVQSFPDTVTSSLQNLEISSWIERSLSLRFQNPAAVLTRFNRPCFPKRCKQIAGPLVLKVLQASLLEQSRCCLRIDSQPEEPEAEACQISAQVFQSARGSFWIPNG